MKVTIKGKEFYLDGYLKNNLDYVWKRVMFHNDMLVTVIDGRPGSGKSTIAAQMAYYLSKGKFSIENETFDSDQFSDGVEKSERGNAIVADEAFELLNKRSTQSSQNRIMLSLMQRMRVKQLFIFIVLPSIYDLDKNLILNLCDLFIHCYRKPFGERGFFETYDQLQLKNLWLYGRQSLSYTNKIIIPNFRGRFTKFFPLDVAEYDKKKRQSLQVKTEDTTDQGKYYQQRNKLVVELSKMGKTPKEIGDIVGLKQRAVYIILKKD